MTKPDLAIGFRSRPQRSVSSLEQMREGRSGRVRDAAENTAEGEPSDRSGVQVLSRAIHIMRALEGEPAGLSLGEISNRLGLAKSTVQRIVRALLDERMLMPAGPASKVVLGPLLLRLAADVRLDVAQIVRPILEQLSRVLGETVDLSVMEDGQSLFIDQVVGSQRLAAVSKVGDVFPLHSGANGKALLAAFGKEAVHALVTAPLLADTVNTITTIAALEKEIGAIAQSGIAYDREEHTIGVCAVGTWFFDLTGRAYSLSVPVPSVRFNDGRGLVEPLRNARLRIISALAMDDGQRERLEGIAND